MPEPLNQRLYDVYRTAGFSDTSAETAAEGYEQLVPLLPARDARILDFGCGGGEFLEFLGSQGFSSIAGIDRSQEQVDRSRARGLVAVELVTETATWLRQHASHFDAIVMNDVLEHIPKPEIISTLDQIRLALKPGGVLVVKVPNAANLFGLVARYLDFTHEVAFTEHSLRQVLVASGFPEVSVGGLQLRWKPTLRRGAYWAANAVYRKLHRALYLAAVGVDAPTVLTKLLVAKATRSR